MLEEAGGESFCRREGGQSDQQGPDVLREPGRRSEGAQCLPGRTVEADLRLEPVRGAEPNAFRLINSALQDRWASAAV